MMREIKFRAWHNQTGTWKMEYFDFFHADCFAMSKNVMQFTGLHDKNGKEIFEGDIVRKYGSISRDDPGYGLYEPTGLIVWSGKAVGFVIQEDYPNGPHEWPGFLELEIIGNIHEAPELLVG